MERTTKIRRTLDMAMLRLQGSDTLLRVEIVLGDKVYILQVLPDAPDTLVSEQGTKMPLDQVPQYLEQLVGETDRGSIRFVERGTIVTLDILGNDVKMSMSTMEAPVHQQPVETGTRQQFIKAGEAMDLLQALEIASPEGKVRADRRRKYYQVDRFVELVDEMLERWTAQRPLTILDCGCGKSYLSFVLNYWLTEKRRIPCKVMGIDGNPAVIEASRGIQRRLNYRNMEFQVGKILDFKPAGPVDMVLSLHACDTATDEALALGLHLGSKYIISVPCCQAALRDRLDYSPWQAVARHSIFRNKLSDVLTDGIRAAALEARGYKVSVVEYVSPLDTPKNIMLRAVHQGGPRDIEEYRKLQELVEGTVPLERFLDVLNNR